MRKFGCGNIYHKLLFIKIYFGQKLLRKFRKFSRKTFPHKFWQPANLFRKVFYLDISLKNHEIL